MWKDPEAGIQGMVSSSQFWLLLAVQSYIKTQFLSIILSQTGKLHFMKHFETSKVLI